MGNVAHAKMGEKVCVLGRNLIVAGDGMVSNPNDLESPRIEIQGFGTKTAKGR
jgi:hypothetical protein